MKSGLVTEISMRQDIFLVLFNGLLVYNLSKKSVDIFKYYISEFNTKLNIIKQLNMTLLQPSWPYLQ